ncbi:hypothetical protein BGZ99_001575 [Dissophora globulifera]|uniref:Spindle pole body component n=1 Tax=Dissophora globulifera TaxID=979702 RepID=A0A9P6RRE8_9FUNG|nr:hypothetical protein BGZ99_001575 [Dissophora globulifera]
MPAIAETTCYNLSKFRATMKSFRVLDDNIMLRLNETNTQTEAACASFFNELVAAYQKRDASIKFCLETMDKNIATKKEKLYQDPDDYTIKDSIMTDESKARNHSRSKAYPSSSTSSLPVQESPYPLAQFTLLPRHCASSSMHDLDPATLLFIPRDEYAPINVDPALFESVGEGLAPSKFSLPAVTAAPMLSSLADPLERLKTLAARLDPEVSQHDLGSRSHQASYTEGHDASRKKVKKGSGGIPEHMGTTESWDAAWEQDLDQRVQSIDRRSIFDAFVDPSTSVFHTFSVDEDVSLPSLFRPETSLQESIVHSTQDKKGIAVIPTESGVDAYVGWNARSVFGSLSHPAGSSVPMNLSKGSADLTFELPPLTKRPRDILDDCTLLDDSSTARLSANRHAGNRSRSDVSPKGDPNMALTTDILERRSDAWRDAGRPSQQDTAIDAGSQAPAGRPDKVQLTWEMLTATGPKVPPEIPITSPYITEAGTRVFEAVYQKHLDYAFKFRPTPEIITHESLLDCAFLLLSGTPSSIFTFNADGMKFEIADQGVRIEGCSTGSIMNMLQDMLDVGTHMRRLVNVAELCSDLLSMLVDEIHKEPTVSDPLWAALLMTLLDQASKPYRDILSRWLGMTPSAHTGHDRTQLSEGTNARRLFSGLGRNSSGIPGNSSSGNSGSSSELLIFDCHLQQSLQGLDPFGEFFVHSQHEWSWDGSAPIILADPLDYDAEFQMSEEILPARFLDEKIAEQMLEAGKELQILVEYEPRHPLIAYGRRTVERSGSGLEWYYIQEDVNS